MVAKAGDINSGFLYLPETHQYSCDGVLVPSVTQVIDSCGFYDKIKKYAKEQDRIFGKYVHKAVELDIKGELDESTIDDILRGPFTAYKKFRRDFPQFEPIVELVEKPLFCKEYWFAGTPDLPMRVVDHKRKKPLYAYIDMKASHSAPVQAYYMQCAAYERLLNQAMGLSINTEWARFILHLPYGTEDYSLTPVNDPRAWNSFVSCINVMKCKLKDGILERNMQDAIAG